MHARIRSVGTHVDIKLHNQVGGLQAVDLTQNSYGNLQFQLVDLQSGMKKENRVEQGKEYGKRHQ